MDDILNLNLGIRKSQTLTIQDVTSNTVIMSDDRKAVKVVLSCETKDGQRRNIDEGWIRDYKGSIDSQGLWLTTDDDGNVSAGSTFGKFLKYTGVKNIKDLIGKEVKVFPKDNGFLAAVTTQINENEF